MLETGGADQNRLADKPSESSPEASKKETTGSSSTLNICPQLCPCLDEPCVNCRKEIYAKCKCFWTYSEFFVYFATVVALLLDTIFPFFVSSYVFICASNGSIQLKCGRLDMCSQVLRIASVDNCSTWNISIVNDQSMMFGAMSTFVLAIGTLVGLIILFYSCREDGLKEKQLQNIVGFHLSLWYCGYLTINIAFAVIQLLWGGERDANSSISKFFVVQVLLLLLVTFDSYRRSFSDRGRVSIKAATMLKFLQDQENEKKGSTVSDLIQRLRKTDVNGPLSSESDSDDL